jgi:hypothetical protein
MRHKGMTGVWWAEKMGGEDIHILEARADDDASRKTCRNSDTSEGHWRQRGLRYTTYLCPKGSSW